uniref:Uncharacterized protein n=1 Tax=viral metagenome TaxID=1070528 RepID=A0A6C0D2A7_9ZZZZ
MSGFSIQIDSIYRNVSEYPNSTDFVVYNSTYGSTNLQYYMENRIYYQYRWYGNNRLWFPGYPYVQLQFQGTISGNTLTVTNILTTEYNGKTTGNLYIGLVLTNVLLSVTTPITIAAGTTIIAFGTGTGGRGTYTVSITQTVASTVMTSEYNSAYQPNNAILSTCSNIISTTIFQLPANYAARDVNFFDGLLFAVPQTYTPYSTLTGIFGEVGESSLLPVYGIVGVKVESQNVGFPDTLNQYNTLVYIDPPPFGGEQATAYATFGSAPTPTGWDLLSITMTNYGSGYIPSFPPYIFIQTSVYQGTSTISAYDPVFNIITLESSLSTNLLTTGRLPFAIFNPSNLLENNLNVLGTNLYLNIYSQNYTAQAYLRNGMCTNFWIQNVTEGWTQKILDFVDENFRFVELTYPMITTDSIFTALFIGTIEGTILTVVSTLSGTVSVGQLISSIGTLSFIYDTVILEQISASVFVISTPLTVSTPTVFITKTIVQSSQASSSYVYDMNDLIQVRETSVNSTIFQSQGTSASRAIYEYKFSQHHEYSYAVGDIVYAIPTTTTTFSTSLLQGYTYASYLVTEVAFSSIPAYQDMLDITSMKLLNPGSSYANHAECFLIPSTTTTFASSYNTIRILKTAYAVELDFTNPSSVIAASMIQSQNSTHQNPDILSYIVYAPKHYTFPIPESTTSSTSFQASFTLNNQFNTVQGSISNTTLNVTSITPPSVGNLAIGQYIYGSTVQENTVITGFLSGTGGIGTYRVNNSQTVSPSTLSIYKGTSGSNMLMTANNSSPTATELLAGDNIPTYASVISTSTGINTYNVYFPETFLTILDTTLFTVSLPLFSGPQLISVTGYIEGDIFNVTAVNPPPATPVAVGRIVTGNGITYNTKITQILTGVGGIGTYRISEPQYIDSQTMYISTFVKTFYGTIPYSSTPGVVAGSILSLPSPVSGLAANQFLTSPLLNLQSKLVTSLNPLKWKITQYLDTETVTPYTLNNGATSPYLSRIFDVPTFYVSFRFLSFIENFLFYDLYNLDYGFQNIFNFITNDEVVGNVVSSIYDTSPPYIILPDTYIELIPVKQRRIGLDMPLIADKQPACYTINLVSLSIPNQPIVGFSTLPSFFPYILVEMQNTSGLSNSIQPITSNNPHTNTTTFVCLIGNPLNQEISNFLVVYAFQSVTMKFLPGDHIRVRIALPNGDTMLYVYDEENVIFSKNPQLADLAFLSNFYTTFPANNITLNLSFSRSQS